MEIVTPDLCDEFADVVEVVEPQFANLGGRSGFGGEMVTVKCFEDNSVVKAQVAEPGTGKVLVVDGGGSLRCALLGDMLAAKAVQSGWEGIIVYGCIRDVDAIQAMDIGVQALSTHPRKSIRKGVGELNIPITFGGVTFKPGNYVYADNNGVIIAPHALITE